MATRWGLVCAGKIAHDFATALRSMPPGSHKIVAVATQQGESAHDFAKLHNIPKIYNTYEELARDSDIQVAHVGVINSHHLPVGKLMLEHGKNVLMEKPFAMNLRQVKELISLAKDKKVFLMEGLWSRFFPAYDHLMKELKDGAIGEVMNVTVNFGSLMSHVDRIRCKAPGGGSLLDVGVYCLSAINMIFQGERPNKIAALAILNEEGVDESVSASLGYSNGRLASMMTSTRVDLPCELVVVGTKGTLKLPKPMWCPTQFVSGDQKIDFPLPPTVLPCNFTNSSGLRYEADEVRRCLNQGLLECPRMTHADSELLHSITDEIRRQVGVEYTQDKL